jgi:hypothetical protein
LRNISKHLRNENFKPNVLLLYCDKPLVHLRSLDKNIRSTTGAKVNTYEQGPIDPLMQKRVDQLPQRYEGFNTDFGVNQLPVMPEIEEVEEISYKHYKVYNSGKFNFELSGKKQKSLDKVNFF